MPTNEDFLVAELRTVCLAAYHEEHLPLPAILRALIDVLVQLPKEFPTDPKWEYDMSSSDFTSENIIPQK